jgi:hypothetical protein
MNILFYSSLGMVLGNFPFIVISHGTSFIKGFYLLGLTTSVLNHGFKTRPLQILDRSVMKVGAVIDLFYITDEYQFILWFCAIYFYFFSKIIKNTTFHVFAHIFVTGLHNNILLKIE